MQFTDLIAPALDLWARNAEGGRSPLPGLTVLKKSEVSRFDSVVYNPVVCLVLKGGKETTIGSQSVRLQAGDVLVVSHDLPVQSRITSASPQDPYLALIISLELGLVRSLHEQIGSLSGKSLPARSLSAGPAETPVLQAIARYLELMNDPVEAAVLGPSILREIHFRLLMSPTGGMLRTLLSV
ncbi:MAG: AraC family transcriptional regulator, partial [Nitratireductor sp.]|nr:AraC family transcriptional regulator [Nitratireductor sp.]